MTLQVTVIPAFERLPYDLLGYIFIFICLGDPLQNPMIISHICRWWRLVALDSSSIWSNVTIRLCTTSNGTSQKHLLASLSEYPDNAYNLCHSLLPVLGEDRADCAACAPSSFGAYRNQCRTQNSGQATLMELNIPMPCLDALNSVISNTSRIRSIERSLLTTKKLISSLRFLLVI
jgi:hypothetical protein